MERGFVILPKSADKKEDTHVIMSLRLERTLQWEYDKLSGKSGRSRNELMCRALQYALEELVLESPEPSEPASVP